jgi:hypothetical protein
MEIINTYNNLKKDNTYWKDLLQDQETSGVITLALLLVN